VGDRAHSHNYSTQRQSYKTMVQVSLSTSTTFEGDLNALVEDQGNALTLRFDLDEPAPAGGLKVYIDSDIEQIINRLDLPAARTNPQFENLDLLQTQTNFDNSGLAVQISAGATFGTVTLDIFDNDEPDTFLPETFDGLVEAVFNLRTADQIASEDQTSITNVDSYTIDPNAASSTVLFADTADQLPGAPEPPTPPASGYDEAVSGDISNNPSDPLDLALAQGETRLSATTGNGDQEYVTVTVPEGSQLASIVLESYSPNDVGFVGVQEGSTFTQPLDNSAELSEFLGYTLFGTSAVGTDILDNIGNGSNGPGFGGQGFEGPLPSGTYTFALQQLGPESDYTLVFNTTEAAVVENAAPVATDDAYEAIIPGVEGAEVPTELTINAAEGVLANDSDANGDDLTVAIATTPENGTIDLNTDGSFTYTPTNGFTSQEQDSFTYTVSDGSGGSDTGSVNIETVFAPNPPPTGDPVVSLEATPASISEEGNAADRLLTLTFTVEGEIPEGGLNVLLNGLFGITNQSDGEDDRGAFDGLGLTPPFDRANNIIGIRLDQNVATLQLPIANDLIEETTTFDFQLAEGDGYTVNPDQSGTLFTITDDNGGPGVGPTVGFSVSETTLAEGDPLTVNFTVDGEIPAGGLEVLVQSSVGAALGQFDLADLSTLQLTGISDVRVGDTFGQSFIATITEANASIGLSIFDDIVAEEPIEVPFTLANGELYEVDPAAETVTFTISDDVQPVGPTVGLTVDKADVTEGETVTLTFAVEGEIPAGGVQVLVNDAASARSGLRSLTEFDIANIDLTGIEGFPTPAEGDSGFFVTITEPTATITLPVLDDGADEDEATESFTFEVVDGEAYEVDTAASSITLNISDATDGTPPTGEDPIVTFSTDTTELVESEGTIVTLSFNIEGTIPEGGLPITLNAAGSDPNWFFDFNNSARPSVNPETGSFDSVAILGRELQGIDGNRLVSRLAPPDFSELDLVITENTASFQLEVFDDVFAEDTETLTLSVAEGEGYAVAQNVAPVTLTFEDSPAGRVDATAPVVSLALDRDTVAEGELLTVNLSVEGDIPAEGLQVFVAGSSAGALGEFAVSELQTTGLAGEPGPDADAGGFVVTIVENEASITLPVFKDGLGEGVENFTFSVVDGELYDIDPLAGEVSLAIEETPPVISVDLVGATFGDDGGIAAPYLIEDDAAGNAILSVVVQSDAPIPEDGLVVNINTDLSDITEFVDGTNFVPTAFGGEVLGAIYNDAGVATGLQVRMDSANTVVNFTTGLGLEATGPQDVTFNVEAGENYIPSAETASITVYDSADQTPMPTSIPEVAISVEQSRPLSEGSGAVTLDFNVTGEIPADGVLVYVATGEFAGLVDFNLLDAGVTGGPFPTPDGQAGGFFFKIEEPTASLTLQAREDEEIEGIEAIDLAVQPLPGYTIADGSGDVSILLRDGRGSEIQVSFETQPAVLVESEGTVSLHTFSLSAPPPEEGITVRLQTPGLADFDASAVELMGITGLEVLESAPEQLSFTITEQTATISLPVANDGVVEGLEEAVFTLLEPGEDANYQVNPEANSGTFTLVDTLADVPAEPIAEDTRNSRDSIGDTIAEAQATGLSADNSSVTIEAAINGNFFNSDRTQTDTTEDVDMYSVELAAGDLLRLDIDAQIFSTEGTPDTVLRLFDADGNQVAGSDDDFAPDELFAPGRRDSYLEFTAETAGTYYAGVSSFGNGAFDFFIDDDGNLENDPYDPNVAGSGAGRSDGPYTLNLSLNEEVSMGATEIPDSTGEGPTISLAATPATYDSEDNLIASVLVQYTPERRNASILTLGLDVEGEIPEEGVEAYLTSNLDLSSVFSTRSPFSSEGTEVLGAVFDDAGTPVGLKVLLTANSGFINLNLADPDEAPTDGEETVSFTLTPAAGYTVGDNTISTTIYDTLETVPALPTVPTVGISVSETALVESEGNTTTLTFTLDSPPPADGLTINVDSGVRAALGEFDVFNAEIEGGNFPSPNFQASGFFFTMTAQTATITLAAFDETTNPEIPAEDVLEGIDELTFAVQPGVGYAIAPDANEFTLTIADNPDSVVLPGTGGEGGEGSEGGEGGEDPAIPVETEFNDTIVDAIVTGLTADNPTYVVTGEIGTTRQTRNFVDRSEDVDMYAFDLEEGQVLTLDVDAGGTGSAGVEGSLMDSVLRVFDADGNEVAVNDNGGAPNEVFQANGDSFLEFAAPAAGTYYVGISNLGNNFYDPNEQASGSGWIFEDRFEPGEYRLSATLSGGSGGGTGGTDSDDTLVGDDADNSLNGFGGNDLIAGGLGNDIITGGDGDDVLRGDLNSRDPQDDGMGGNDIIFGGEGNDRIGGKAGNDILSGDAGDDFIWGDDGDDIIMGVTGNDTLVGDNGSDGSGSDLFIFGNGDGTDTILDFEVGTDRIGLVEGELMFADLTITQDGSTTLLGVASSGETLAILNGVQASSLTESSFEVVADVSNPEEALALI